MRYALASLALLAWFGPGNAAETVRLKGGDASTKTLKANADTDAETIAVCHGCCRRCFTCCQPAVVAYGCTGCFGGGGGAGGGYSMSGPTSYGMSGMDYAASPYYVPTPAYAYNAPSRSYYSAPAPSYYTPPAPSYAAPAPSNYALAPTRAVVTLPRLGLSFAIGGNNGGMLASRAAAANRIAPPTPPPAIDDTPIAPPIPGGRPDQYRYDGGPSNPIPLPGGEAPAATPTPTLNNRVKAVPAARGYLAYGERSSATIKPDARANTTFVKDR